MAIDSATCPNDTIFNHDVLTQNYYSTGDCMTRNVIMQDRDLTFHFTFKQWIIWLGGLVCISWSYDKNGRLSYN